MSSCDPPVSTGFRSARDACVVAEHAGLFHVVEHADWFGDRNHSRRLRLSAGEVRLMQQVHDGVRVLIGSRSTDKGAEALQRLHHEAPGSQADVLALDLSSLAAIEDAAGRLGENENQLDILVNNAGVMMPSVRGTADQSSSAP